MATKEEFIGHIETGYATKGDYIIMGAAMLDGEAARAQGGSTGAVARFIPIDELFEIQKTWNEASTVWSYLSAFKGERQFVFQEKS